MSPDTPQPQPDDETVERMVEVRNKTCDAPSCSAEITHYGTEGQWCDDHAEVDDEAVERMAMALCDVIAPWGVHIPGGAIGYRKAARAALAVARPLIRSAVLTEVRACCAESYDDPRLRAIEVVMHREMWDLLNADPDAAGVPDDLR